MNEKIAEIVDAIGERKVKKVKADNGLIERREMENKVILTEDNRQVIFD